MAASPFQFMVIDPNRVIVRGDGLGLVRAQQQATFFLIAPPAQLKDIDICITGSSFKIFLLLLLLIIMVLLDART